MEATDPSARTLRFRTDMHCTNCVDRLARSLEELTGLHHWQADLQAPERWVELHGLFTEEAARSAIAQAGLHVMEQGEVTAAEACPLPMHAHTLPVQVKSGTGFWSDRSTWRRALFNTFTCLVGCSIGDFAMLAYLQGAHAHVGMAPRMALSIIAGLITSVLLETVLLRRREQLAWGRAFRMAVGMSFLSMVAMEVAMNTTDLMITGGSTGWGLDDPRYWLAFIPAALAGLLVPLPYNYHQLRKHGKACH